MQIFFAGAEVGSHLKLLRSCGVERVAVNVSNLVRTAPKGTLGTWASKDRLEGLEWVFYADSSHVPVEPVLEVLNSAEVPPEAITGPISWYDQTWLRDSDLLFLPTWDGGDPTVLRHYTETFDGVMLPDSVVENPTAVRTAKAALNRLGVLGALTGKSKGLERFDMLVSSAWWSTLKYGETQVWTGSRLVRLNREDKDSKRQRYSEAIEALGCDLEQIMVDDPQEVQRCAVLSWLALEEYTAQGRAPRSEPEVPTLHSVPAANVVPIAQGVARPPALTRHHMLPVMSLGATTTLDADGNEEVHHTIQVTPQSLRSCNTCSLQVACPAFSPNSACSYQIPVMLRTKAQLLAVLRAVTEIQTQRIMMGRFAEEVNGEPDEQVGREMDRLFGMVEKWRNIEDQRDSLKISVEAKGEYGKTGVLSRLFGSEAGRNASMLDEPIPSDEIIDEMTDD